MDCSRLCCCLRQDLDSYLKGRSPVTFLSELRSNLQVSSEPGMRYNIPLMNALALYVGTEAIAHIHAKGQTSSMSTIAHSSHMDIFQNLAVDLDTEGRCRKVTCVVEIDMYNPTCACSCCIRYFQKSFVVIV